MNLLLDTHVFLWWRADAADLGVTAREAIADERNAIYVSAAVAWEIVIKRALGKLTFDGTTTAAIAEEGFVELPVTTRHVDAVADLADHHRDPFDRILIAQARCEGLTLVTADPQVLAYGGALLSATAETRRRRARR